MLERSTVRLLGAELREATGRQRGPVAVQPGAPAGTERLYSDGLFFTEPDICEEYGHDLNMVTRSPRWSFVR